VSVDAGNVTGIVKRKEVIIPVLIFLAMIAPRGVFSIAEYFGVDLPFVPMMIGWILTITILPLAFALFYKDVSPVIAFMGCLIAYIMGAVGDAFLSDLLTEIIAPGLIPGGIRWGVVKSIKYVLFGSYAPFCLVKALSLGVAGAGATRAYSNKVNKFLLISGSLVWIFLHVRELIMFIQEFV